MIAFITLLLPPFVFVYDRQKILKREKNFHENPVHKFSHWKTLVASYSILLFLMNFIRVFDNNFWGDEAFSVFLIQKPVSEIIAKTAADVHPPLYYLLLKIAYTVFGGLNGVTFHVVSLIPYAIILILAMTVIWDTFGREVSIILITIAGLSGNAVYFNMEVRMYSWGALFVLLSFLELNYILQDKKNRNYILFLLFSLAAAYTHYYCLISVAFFYLSILAAALFLKRLNIKKVLALYISAVIGYLPWFFILVKTLVTRIEKGFWISGIPTLEESLSYLFSDQFTIFICLFSCAAFIVCFLYETNSLKLSKDADNKLLLSLSLEEISISNTLILIMAGILSISGTIGFGILISKLFRPFYLLRYLYPVSIIAWLLLGIIISRLKGKSFYTAILTLYMLLLFLPGYLKIYSDERHMNNQLKETLEVTSDKIKDNDIILTNNTHINWTIAKYYYPGIETMKIDSSDLPLLNPAVSYWFIADRTKEDTNSICEQIELQGFVCDQVVVDGNLGTNPVDIYLISFEK